MSSEMTIEDLNPVWMADGLPCFLADADNICDVIESFGFNIYYLLGNQAKETKATTTTVAGKTTTTPAFLTKNAQLYRVVNNFVGRTITVSSPAFTDNIISVQEEATYNLPAIPHVLIDKLDQFFRLVDAQHGTESIVMLTYDLDKEGSEGWGILVPDQVNTSVHCNYDPHSIAEVKPDNVMIVGSVHSHPGMSAYASGTDHKDQADFDGIHITFGWQKSVNNGATQYYIEMQMAGKAYTLDPEDVFEDYIIDKAPDPEVVGWTDKVKKVSPPKAGGSVTVTTGAPYQTPRPQTIPPTQGYTVAGTSPSNTGKIIYPNHILDIIEEAIGIGPDIVLVCEVVANVDDTSYNCPACFSIVSRHDVFARSCCPLCDVPLSEPDTSADNVIWDMFDYCNSRKISTESALWMLTRDYENNYLVMRLTPTTMDAYNEGVWVDADTTLNTPPTLCCSLEPSNCMCSTQVLKADAFDFDNFMGKLNVYANNSVCETCELYYDVACPAYSQAIVKYMSDTKNSDESNFDQTIDGVGCSSFVPYSYATEDVDYR